MPPTNAKRRLIVGGMLVGISVTLFLSARLYVPDLLVEYHLREIAQDRKVPEHIASLVWLGRFARPELLRLLERQKQFDAGKSPEMGSQTYKRVTAATVVLATAYENGKLTPAESHRFVTTLIPAQVRGFDRKMVRCMLPIGYGLPHLYSETLDGKPNLSIPFDILLYVDGEIVLPVRSFSSGDSIQVNSHQRDPRLMTSLFVPDYSRAAVYLDFTSIPLGRHTVQAQYISKHPSSPNDKSDPIVFETPKYEFWIVEPKVVENQ